MHDDRAPSLIFAWPWLSRNSLTLHRTPWQSHSCQLMNHVYLWQSMTIPGQCMNHGYLWQSMTIPGHCMNHSYLWQSMTVPCQLMNHGYLWQSMTSHDNVWIMSTYDNPCTFNVIAGWFLHQSRQSRRTLLSSQSIRQGEMGVSFSTCFTNYIFDAFLQKVVSLVKLILEIPTSNTKSGGVIRFLWPFCQPPVDLWLYKF